MRKYLQKHNKIKYSNHWSTPREIYDYWVKEMQYLDPCPLYGDKKDKQFMFEYVENDIFLNPPYERGVIEKWIDWAIENHKRSNNHTIILIPSRTDTKYFHKLLECGCDLEFIKGRLKFGGVKTGAPFPSVLVHLGLSDWTPLSSY